MTNQQKIAMYNDLCHTSPHDVGSPDLLVIRVELPLEVGMEGQKSAFFGPSRRPPGHFPGRLPYPGPSIIK